MSPRRFDALRSRPVASVASEQEEPVEARARRLFMSGADGPAVLAWMMERANRVTPLGAGNDVLREAEGARRFMTDMLREIAPPVR